MFMNTIYFSIALQTAFVKKYIDFIVVLIGRLHKRTHPTAQIVCALILLCTFPIWLKKYLIMLFFIRIAQEQSFEVTTLKLE